MTPHTKAALRGDFRFNINDYVRVRLTGEGLKVHDDHFHFFGIVRQPDTDSEGWSRFQLWDLMKIFGKHMYNGGPNMFDTEILIPLTPSKPL